jgi:hypothetical protein
MNPQPQISKTRLIFGGAVIVVGFMSPLLIPFIASLDWSFGLKSAISGLLALGIPEVFMLIGVAILGKDGYQFLKEKLFGFLKQFAPPDFVSLNRYRIGLVMFFLPLIVAWATPYLGHFVPNIEELPLWSFILGDLIFFASFIVLGGNFWDKLSGLFKYDVLAANRRHNQD